MTTEPPSKPGFRSEFRLILRRVGEVWRLVPRGHKFALTGSTLFMSVSCACGTMIAILLGMLISAVGAGAGQGMARADLVHLAGFYLALLAGVYLLREFLNVVRRYLAENTC